MVSDDSGLGKLIWKSWMCGDGSWVRGVGSVPYHSCMRGGLPVRIQTAVSWSLADECGDPGGG